MHLSICLRSACHPHKNLLKENGHRKKAALMKEAKKGIDAGGNKRCAAELFCKCTRSHNSHGRQCGGTFFVRKMKTVSNGLSSVPAVWSNSIKVNIPQR